MKPSLSPNFVNDVIEADIFTPFLQQRYGPVNNMQVGKKDRLIENVDVAKGKKKETNRDVV